MQEAESWRRRDLPGAGDPSGVADRDGVGPGGGWRGEPRKSDPGQR